MASAGRVLLLPKGTWTAGTSYVPLDYVLYNGSSYVCKTATNGSTNPESDTSHWQKLAQGLTSTELSEVQSVVGDVADLKTDKINHTDALSKEEIAASTDLTGKVPSAAAFSQLNSDLYSIVRPNAGSHNSIYRGAFLGTTFTQEQSDSIRNGTFNNLFIGDYWTIDGVNYRIADFDYFLRSGDTECTNHHAVIVPDPPLYRAKMNTSNVTTGGYVNSAMYTENLATAKTTIRNAFGTDHILDHREYLCNAVANGRPSGGSWLDSDIELMSESMAYGGNFFEPTSDGSTVPVKYSIACKQLNLFRHRPDLISNRTDYWLRNVVSASHFANVSPNGHPHYSTASTSLGVRPTFCVY